MKRLALGLAAAALVGPLLTGCSLNSPLRTSQQYTPADGMSVDLADSEVGVRNALIVADEDGEYGAVVASVMNNSSDDETVLFAFSGEHQEEVEVPAFSTVTISPQEDTSITVELGELIPGQLFPALTVLQSSTQASSGQLINMPIMASELERYTTLTPTRAPSTSTTSTASSSPSATPTTATTDADTQDDAELEDTEATPSATATTSGSATSEPSESATD